MKTLDRTRPFGIISPPHNGIHFQQDGLDFNASGEEIVPGKAGSAVAVGKASDPITNADPAMPGVDDPYPGGDAHFQKKMAWAKRHGFEGSKKDELTAWLAIQGYP